MSDLFLDTTYMHKISYKLQRFHKTAKDKYAFRCPICGDSDKDKSKTRGNFQIHKGQLFSGCYNGCAPLPFPAFLKRIAPEDYDEYLIESFGTRKKPVINTVTKSKPSFKAKITSDAFFDTLRKISDLPESHPARLYVENRGLKQLDKLYYTPKFKHFCNVVKPNSFEDEKYDTPRLIIPFIDKNGKPFCFQGRSFDKNSKVKYVTIKLDEDMPKIYGLDNLRDDLPKLLLEGPLNSMFLINAVGAAGSNLDSYAEMLGDPIEVFDNDSRNKNIVNLVEKSIQKGRKVVLWDNRFKTGEDINDIANNYNLTPEEITKYLIEHSYQGLEAELHFAKWKKI